MKHSIKLLAVAVVAFISFGFILGEVLPIGSDLPMRDVMMKNATGKEISLEKAAGKNGLLVMFSCNTCPYVIKNQERTLAAAKQAASYQFGTILLNSNEAQRSAEDSYTAMKTYAKDQGYTFPYTMDDNSLIADAFGATRTPECFLFDNNMKLVYHGAIDDNPSDAASVSKRYLEAAMKQVIDGEEVAVKESKSVGCSIKRIK